MSRYRFICAERVTCPIAVLCWVLRVSQSGYYVWADRRVWARAQADQELTTRITAIHERSRRSYSVLRLHAELRAGPAARASGWPGAYARLTSPASAPLLK